MTADGADMATGGGLPATSTRDQPHFAGDGRHFAGDWRRFAG